jgi:hypothetical protein
MNRSPSRAACTFTRSHQPPLADVHNTKAPVSIVHDHFEELKLRGKFPGATLTPVPNGTFLVQIPDFSLPDGWSSRTTTVYFLVPVGYPVARPDTFWTERTLVLRGGGPPMSSGEQNLPGVPPNLRWFSWHPQAWNPNRDNLVNYARAISQRFKDPR